MTAPTDTTAVQLLEEWLSGNRLASQHEAYINVQSRMSDFAAGIEPVAQGMLALARIDTKGKHTKVVDVAKRALFPRCIGISGPSKRIVLLNQQEPDCGCRPTGSDAFAPYGRLGLKAVTLQVGDGHRHGTTVAQLGLVLPQRALNAKDTNKGAYTVVTINLQGLTNGYTYTPDLHKDGYLRYALGLIELDQAIGCYDSGGGHFDDIVGFPGATDYLADALPKLGEYFAALGEKLSSDHKHWH